MLVVILVPKPLKSALAALEDQVWLNLVARDLLWSDPGQSCDLGKEKKSTFEWFRLKKNQDSPIILLEV